MTGFEQETETIARIDGGIVLDQDSNLLALSAIPRHRELTDLHPQNIEGGRTTAAIAASRFGNVLKVSLMRQSESQRKRVGQPQLFRLPLPIICGRGVALLHVTIAVRGPRKHVDRSLLRTVTLPATTPLSDLRSFVLGNHDLELHHQLIFRSSSRR